uniref:Uncharacterized protein n=1 Tax=Ixodes scapularis TaxID=6945 RepID=A0A4D5RB24_IXOSC
MSYCWQCIRLWRLNGYYNLQNVLFFFFIISISFGGSNSESNLWTRPNTMFHSPVVECSSCMRSTSRKRRS